MKKNLLIIVLLLLAVLVPAVSLQAQAKTPKTLVIGIIDEDYILKRWGAYREASQEYIEILKNCQGNLDPEQEKNWLQKEKLFKNKLAFATDTIRKKEKIDLVTLGCGYKDKDVLVKQYGKHLQFLDYFEQLPKALEVLLRR